jgi:hypothetical protein
MSAYMVDREHIDALVELVVFGPGNRPVGHPGGGWRSSGPVRWWTVDAATLRKAAWDDLDDLRRRADPTVADATGAMLIAANLASIHHRYPDTRDGGAVPGPALAYWDEPYVARFVHPAPTAVEGLKLLDCYEYQACEHPEWPTSEAQSFCDALRSRLIHELDGYDAAPWGWPARVEARS